MAGGWKAREEAARIRNQHFTVGEDVRTQRARALAEAKALTERSSEAYDIDPGAAESNVSTQETSNPESRESVLEKPRERRRGRQAKAEAVETVQDSEGALLEDEE